jgi:hypothetical protein
LGHRLEATFTSLSREKILVAYHGLAGELWDPSEEIYLLQRHSVNDTGTEEKPFCREELK